MKELLKKTLKLILPVALGGFVLFWVYHDFDFTKVGDVLLHGINRRWVLFSLVSGVFARVFHGWRWRQALEPLNAFPKKSDCVNTIFISYAASLVVLRTGEVSRCGVLAKYDNVSFAKSLGTAITERLVDILTILLITGITAPLQLPIFVTFLQQTGAKIPSLVHFPTLIWLYIILFCFIGVAILLYYSRKMLFFYERVKNSVLNVWEGTMSLKGARNVPLSIFYTLAIWACYSLHFYFTFYRFALTTHLGILAVLVMFVGDTLAVIVPAPNGARPWHFTITSMMMLYGVNVTDTGIFALIMHGIQTFLVILLGIYGFAVLSFANRHRGWNFN